MGWTLEAQEVNRVCKGNKEKVQEILVTLWELGYPNRSMLDEIWKKLRITDVPGVNGRTLIEFIQYLDQQP